MCHKEKIIFISKRNDELKKKWKEMKRNEKKSEEISF